jgi:SEC-C motif domain protein
VTRSKRKPRLDGPETLGGRSPLATGSGTDAADPCPCGAGKPYGNCCGPLHAGERRAATCEQLMRARYTAYVVGDGAFLLCTWDPSVRPVSISFDPGMRWTGLEILGSTGGNLLDTEGTVDFVASYEHTAEGSTTSHSHREHSRFVRNDSRWVYLDAD